MEVLNIFENWYKKEGYRYSTRLDLYSKNECEFTYIQIWVRFRNEVYIPNN